MKNFKKFLTYLIISITCCLSVGLFVFTGIVNKIYAESTADMGGFAVISAKSTVNIKTGTKISGFRANNGGAFYVSGGLNIYGGTITGNTAVQNGGAAYVASGGVLEIYGGSITGNTAAKGSAVYINGGSMKIGGGTVEGDIYLGNYSNLSLQLGTLKGKVVDDSTTGCVIDVLQDMNLKNASFVLGDKSRIDVGNDDNGYTGSSPRFNIKVSSTRSAGEIVRFYGKGYKPNYYTISGYDTENYYPTVVETTEGWSIYLAQNRATTLLSTWKEKVVEDGNVSLSSIEKIVFTTEISSEYYMLYKKCTIGSIDVCFNAGVLYFAYDGKIMAPQDSSNLFNGLESLKEIEFGNFYAENLINASFMFANCTSLKELYIYDNFDFSAVTLFTGMFQNCEALSYLECGFITSNATDMSFMYSGCKSLQDIMEHHYFGEAENAKLKSIRGMFSGCKKIEYCNLNELLTVNVTDMSYVFDGCSSLTTVEIGDSNYFSNVTTMKAMFRGCASLSSVKTSAMDTSKVTDFSSMFEGCGITDFDGLDGTSATDMSYMFYDAPNLVEFYYTKMITNKVTDMSYMFGSNIASVTKLSYVDLGDADTSKVTSMAGLFQNRNNLDTIKGFQKIDTSSLTHASNMFFNLRKLATLDISAFSARSLVSYSGMLDFSCEEVYGKGHGLKTVITEITCPENLPFEIPFAATGKFYREDTNQVVSAVPANLTRIINLKILGNVQLTDDWSSYFSSSDVKNLIFDTTISESEYSKIGETQSGISIYQSKTNSGDYAVIYLGEIYAPQDCSNLFRSYSNLESVVFRNLNTSNVTNMYAMFDGCVKLKTLDLSSFDTSKVQNMITMFSNCNALESVNVSSFTTLNVKEFQDMFAGCYSLKVLDLGSFYIAEDAAVSGMLDLLDNSQLEKFVAPYFCAAELKMSTGNTLFYRTLYSSDGESVYETLGLKNIEAGRTYIAGIMITTDIVQKYNFATKVVFSNTLPSSDYVLDNQYSITDSKTQLSVYVLNKEVWFYFPRIIFSPTNSSNLFNDFSDCREYVFDNFNTQYVTDMSLMFAANYCLQNLDISMFNTLQLLNMGGMFKACEKLEKIKLFSRTSRVEDMNCLFSGCGRLEGIDLGMLDTSSVTIMNSMFSYCEGLKRLDLSNFDTSNVKDLAYMFSNCMLLEKIDVSSFIFDNVTDVTSMFDSCKNLKTIIFSDKLNTEKITNMMAMFQYCTSLEDLDLSMFSTVNVTDVQNMFYHCESLRTLDLSSFELPNMTNCGGMLDFYSNLDWIKTPFNVTQRIPFTANCDLYDIDTLEKVTAVPAGDSTSHTYAQSLILPTTWKTEVNALLPSGKTVFNNLSRIYFFDDITQIEGVSVTYTNLGKLSTNIDVYYYEEEGFLAFYAPMKIKLPANSSNLFSNLSIKTINIKNTSTSGVTNMSWMFANCSRLTGVNFGDLDTSSVTNMSYMFYNCSSMIGVYMVNQNTSNVTNMAAMFSGCSSLTLVNALTESDIANTYSIEFNTKNVINMSSMFENCSSLTGGGDKCLNFNFSTEKVKDFSRMFAGCSKIENFAFNYITFASAVNLNAMFKNCKSAVQICFYFENETTGENITNMSSMFAGCILLETIKNLDLLKTSSLQEMNYMFLDCQYLAEIDMTNFDLSNVTETSCVFEGTNISLINAPKYIPTSVNIDLYTTLYNKPSRVGYTTLCNENAGNILIKRFTITVNANNGTLSYTTGWTISSPNAQKFVYYGDSIGTFVTVVRTGYTLNGFYTDITTGIEILASYKITHDYTLYARWTKTAYTLTFNPNTGSTSTSSKTIYYQQSIGTVPIPTKTGYEFLGWSRNYFEYSKIINRFGACTPSGTGEFTLKPTSSVQTTYALAISTYNGTSFVSTILSRNETGRYGVSFTKSSSFNRLQFKYKGDQEEAGFYYDLSGLVNGQVYTVSVNVTTMALNNIVLNNIMIERNTSNTISTYTNDYVTASTYNTLAYGYTVFARWKVKTVTVDIANLSGDGYEGSVMGNVNGRYSISVKYGDTLTISYSPNGLYAFSKIVKGTTWGSPTISGTTYTITAADADVGKISIRICYMVAGYLHSVSDGDVDDATGGTVKLYANQTPGASVSNDWAYGGPNIERTIYATPKESWTFDGWFKTADCSGTAVSTDAEYTFKTGSNGNFTYYAKFVPTQKVLPTSWKTEVASTTYMTTTVTPANLTKISFETVAPTGYSQIGRLSTKLQVYANDTDANEIAFVFNKIVAPANCEKLFYGLTNVKTILFNTFDTSKATTFASMFQNCLALLSIDLSSFKTPLITSMASMFNGCEKLTSANLSGISTSNVTNMESLFSGCVKLGSISFSFDTANVTKMNSMFADCATLTILNLNEDIFNTSNVETMASMFSGCSKLQTITWGTNFSTSKVTDISYMYYQCTSLTELDLSKFDFSKVTSFDNAFNLGDNKAIESINGQIKANPTQKIPITCDMTVGYWSYSDGGIVDSMYVHTSGKYSYIRRHETTFLSSWKNYYSGYANIKSITFSSTVPGSSYTLNSINVGTGIKTYVNSATKEVIFSFIGTIYAPTDCSNLFYNCSGMEEIVFNNFNTSKTTNMKQMFSVCTSLTSIWCPFFNTSNVTTMSQMFQRCESLTSLDLSSFKTSSVKSFSWMFHGCSALKTLNLSSLFTSEKATDVSWMFNGCSALKKLDLSSMDLSALSTTSSDTYNGMLNFTTSSNLYYFKTPKNSPVVITPTYNKTTTTDVKWYKLSTYSYSTTSTINVPANSASVEYRKGFILTAKATEGTISQTIGWMGFGESATKIVSDGDVFGRLPTITKDEYRLKYWHINGGSSIDETSVVSLSSMTKREICPEFRVNTALFPSDWQNQIATSDRMNIKIQPHTISSIMFLKMPQFSSHGVSDHTFYGFIENVSVYAKETDGKYSVVFTYGNYGEIWAPENCARMFAMLNVKTYVFSNFVGTMIRYADYMFNHNDVLETIDMSRVDISNVQSAYELFDFGSAPISLFKTPLKTPAFTISITSKYDLYAAKTDGTPATAAVKTLSASMKQSITLKRVFTLVFHAAPYNSLGISSQTGTFSTTTGYTISGSTAYMRVFAGSIVSTAPKFTPPIGYSGYTWKTSSGGSFSTITIISENLEFYPVYT